MYTKGNTSILLSLLYIRRGIINIINSFFVSVIVHACNYGAIILQDIASYCNVYIRTYCMYQQRISYLQVVVLKQLVTFRLNGWIIHPGVMIVAASHQTFCSQIWPDKFTIHELIAIGKLNYYHTYAMVHIIHIMYSIWYVHTYAYVYMYAYLVWGVIWDSRNSSNKEKHFSCTLVSLSITIGITPSSHRL